MEDNVLRQRRTKEETTKEETTVPNDDPIPGGNNDPPPKPFYIPNWWKVGFCFILFLVVLTPFSVLSLLVTLNILRSNCEMTALGKPLCMYLHICAPSAYCIYLETQSRSVQAMFTVSRQLQSVKAIRHTSAAILLEIQNAMVPFGGSKNQDMKSMLDLLVEAQSDYVALVQDTSTQYDDVSQEINDYFQKLAKIYYGNSGNVNTGWNAELVDIFIQDVVSLFTSMSNYLFAKQIEFHELSTKWRDHSIKLQTLQTKLLGAGIKLSEVRAEHVADAVTPALRRVGQLSCNAAFVLTFIPFIGWIPAAAAAGTCVAEQMYEADVLHKAEIVGLQLEKGVAAIPAAISSLQSSVELSQNMCEQIKIHNGQMSVLKVYLDQSLKLIRDSPSATQIIPQIHVNLKTALDHIEHFIMKRVENPIEVGSIILQNKG